MRYIVANIKKLVNIFREIQGELEAHPDKTINLSWEWSFREKTKSQLGYFFGGIVEAIQNTLQKPTEKNTQRT